jgi:hypothetical protein
MSIKDAMVRLEKATDDLSTVMEDYAETLRNNLASATTTATTTTTTKAPPKKKASRKKTTPVKDEVKKEDSTAPDITEPEKQADSVADFQKVKVRLQEICKVSPKASDGVRAVLSALGHEKLSAVPADKYDELLEKAEAVYEQALEAMDNTPPDLS